MNLNRDVRLISCENDKEYDLVLELMKKRYENTEGYEFREVSDTILLPDKKWIFVYESQLPMLIHNAKRPGKFYTAKLIKESLIKEGIVEVPLYELC